MFGRRPDALRRSLDLKLQTQRSRLAWMSVSRASSKPGDPATRRAHKIRVSGPNSLLFVEGARSVCKASRREHE